MQIEELGEISKFETLPTEVVHYFAMVRYEKCNTWSPGPCSTHKEEVFKALINWVGIEAARIYSIKLPVSKNISPV